MPNLLVYDATEVDKDQLGPLLPPYADTAFIPSAINESNCDPDAEAISVFVTSTVTKEMMAKMPKLQLIACRSTGYNNIDLPAAQERNIAVVNVPTYGENTVAEYTFMLLLALSRKLPATQQAVHTASIHTEDLRGTDLKDKTIGIIGAGHIGQHVATIAQGFGMRVVAHDPYLPLAVANEKNIVLLELDQLLKTSDFISLHTPYSKQNHHLINADKLSLIKSNAILINTARGELIDNKALLEVVQNNKIGGVGLDVIEGEQLLNVEEEIVLLRKDQISPEDLQHGIIINALQKFPNVIITPHNAFNTEEAIRRINQTTAQNIIAFAEGKPVNTIKTQPTTMGRLIITRHGESEWNALGKWTGSRDVHLTEKGFHEAAKLGIAMKDIHIDYAFCSQQIRAFETLEAILDSSQQFDVPYERNAALNERDYGDYTGKNKWEMRDLLGQEAFDKLRRDWDEAVPNGETLKMVYDRTVPFYKEIILKHLQNGEDVLVVSHGNAIRALIKYIEDISDTNISTVEMLFGQIVIYDVDANGRKVNKLERTIDITPPPA